MLGKMIHLRRDALGLTRAFLARRAGVSVSDLVRIEDGLETDPVLLGRVKEILAEEEWLKKIDLPPMRVEPRDGPQFYDQEEEE